jgi:hypothetical protein
LTTVRSRGYLRSTTKDEVVVSRGNVLRQQVKNTDFGFKLEPDSRLAVVELHQIITEARWRRRYSEERQMPELIDIGGES